MAFMTSVVTLSLPEALMLEKNNEVAIVGSIFGITIVGIMLIGFVLNWVS